MKLLVVESPGKIKKIRSFLGAGWEVRASVGHIRDLPPKDLGVGYEGGKVRLDYQNSRDKAKAIRDIKDAAERASEIFLAMDPDREGEAIAYHVGIVLGKKAWPKIRRISFIEITKEAVQSALEHPRRVDSALVQAQQARRVVDRLVGFRVSPMLWRAKSAGTSAGRVQSVAVRLIVEREREIRGFQPKEYWRIRGLFSAGVEKDSPEFWADLLKWKNCFVVPDVVPEKKQRQVAIASQEESAAILEELHRLQQWTVKDFKEQERDTKPQAPFITSTLQQAAITSCRFAAAQTMKVAQSLYEKGLITYMRTDATTISDGALKAVRAYIADRFPEHYLPKTAASYKTKVKNAQEAHECIRPTEVERDLKHANVQDLTTEEQKLYGLIWKRFVASQMMPAKHAVVTIDVESGPALFRARGRRLLFDGWMKLYAKDSKEKRAVRGERDSDEQELLLPKVSASDALEAKAFDGKQHFTKAPPRYTEATLIKVLESYGIGRPSTYASILDNIKRRGYVSLEKRLFFAQQVGENLVDLLVKTFDSDWFNYAFTADMERDLDRIANREVDWNRLVIEFDQKLLAKLGPEVRRSARSSFSPKKTDISCEKCSQPMVVRNGRRGEFLGCSGFPKCTFTRDI